MSGQPWVRQIWEVGRPLIPPGTNSTHSPSPDPSVWRRGVLFRTARPHLHQFHRLLQFYVFQPKTLLILSAKGRSKNVNQSPVKNVSQTIHPDFPAWVHHKITDKKSFHITQLGSIPKFPTKHHCFDPSPHPTTAQEKFHHNTEASRHLQIHNQQTPFHTPNLTTIIFYHHHSLHPTHPYSISHMGYPRPSWRPHGSHCTRIQGWIALPGPVSNSVMYPVVRKG